MAWRPVELIPIDFIRVGKRHREFSNAGFDAFVERIKADGCLVEPIWVRPLGEDYDLVFGLVDGFRRLKAVKRLGFDVIEAIILDLDEADLVDALHEGNWDHRLRVDKILDELAKYNQYSDDVCLNIVEKIVHDVRREEISRIRAIGLRRARETCRVSARETEAAKMAEPDEEPTDLHSSREPGDGAKLRQFMASWDRASNALRARCLEYARSG